MTGRPSLLFLSPVVPNDAGNGLAMRAAMFLRAYGQRYSIRLSVIPVLGATPDSDWPGVVAATCDQATIHGEWLTEDPLYAMISKIADADHRVAALAAYSKPELARFPVDAACNALDGMQAAAGFDAVHVSRLYLAPFATVLIRRDRRRRPACWLDSDDFESMTHDRLARLAALTEDDGAARWEAAEADKYRAMEAEYFPRFDLVFTASAIDRQTMVASFPGCTFRNIPNAVRLPPESVAKPAGARPFTLLLVGTMGYYPNIDAVHYFITEIMPLLGGGKIRFVVAGANPPRQLLALNADPAIMVTGTVDDVAPYYAEADLVVVPLRAGGGTRIKILEAFAHRRAVVATTLAAEGLAVEHERHLLIADTPEAFARACDRLRPPSAFADGLVKAARDLVRKHYSTDIVESVIQAEIS
jgi:glycosyltransferase involved in cell wall biosynthesis